MTPARMIIELHENQNDGEWITRNAAPRVPASVDQWFKVQKLVAKFGNVQAVPSSLTQGHCERRDGQYILRAPTPNEALHELGHLQVAAPWRRKWREFGLSRMANEKSRLRAVFCDYEEMLASILGILWTAHIGLDFVGHFFDHDWWDCELSRINAVLLALEKLRLVKRGRPQIRFRPGGSRLPFME